MKKLTLILLLIPMLNNSQTISDLCRINSNDFFKKTATELNYEKVIENDEYTGYALEPKGKEDLDTMTSMAGAYYFPNENLLSWAFVMENIFQAKIYNTIYNEVKVNWKYLKITDVSGTDYVTYEGFCGGKDIQLGFSLNDGIGTVIRF